MINRQVVYIIAPVFIIVYPLAAMYVLSSYNAGVLNNSQLVVVLIGRLMCGATSVAPWRLRYESYRIRKHLKMFVPLGQ